MAKSLRNSNIELLRILSMAMIVLYHYSVWGCNSLAGVPIFSKIYLDLLAHCGKFGVNCFVFITGYYMINTNFSAKRLIRLWAQTFTYAISWFILYSILTDNISIKNLVKAIFPVIYNQYWFVTDYMILILLAPFLNDILKSWPKEAISKFMLLLLIVFYALPTLLAAKIESSNLCAMIVCYTVGGYTRLYNTGSRKFWEKLLIILIPTIIIFVVGMNSLGAMLSIPKLLSLARWFTSSNSLVLLVMSYAAFCVSIKARPWSNRWINNIATRILAVYLIHDNNLGRQIIWQDIFHTSEIAISGNVIIHSLASLVLIIGGSLIIESIRIMTIQKPLVKIMERLVDTIEIKAHQFRSQLF